MAPAGSRVRLGVDELAACELESIPLSGELGKVGNGLLLVTSGVDVSYRFDS